MIATRTYKQLLNNRGVEGDKLEPLLELPDINLPAYHPDHALRERVRRLRLIVEAFAALEMVCGLPGLIDRNNIITNHYVAVWRMPKWRYAAYAYRAWTEVLGDIMDPGVIMKNIDFRWSTYMHPGSDLSLMFQLDFTITDDELHRCYDILDADEGIRVDTQALRLLIVKFLKDNDWCKAYDGGRS